MPPPADVTGGNKETSEDDDEPLCVIIRRTSKEHKHRLATAVGWPESEWSFIGEGYAASMRGGTVEEWWPFGVEDLPPMDTPRVLSPIRILVRR
ncbi:hypothetical protein GUJ93_ZPchr2178g2968 [Zizania palustris]|uniref:Uncharacterized protein n=1 Tax=Zizania palustris TaxID=103762 RepID=A0A8J5R7H2_ZIZPA|nr:hypothetical protein GUJ93_ZPchr2178g2968 [Zizania palustris]